MLSETTEKIRKNVRERNSLYAIEASGDSMEPRISDGDVILANTADKDLQSGRVYVLLVPGEGLRGRRVHRQAAGRIRISSDNPDKVRYPDEEYSPEEASHLNVLGRAVWVWREVSGTTPRTRGNRKDRNVDSVSTWAGRVDRQRPEST